MNLHGIVSGAIQAVNPSILGWVQVSDGTYTTAADGTRVPGYRTIPSVPLQIQAMGFRDLQQVDGLNLNGTRRKIYMYGKFDGLVRPEGKGGDLVVFPEGSCWPFGTTWLIAMVLEQYPDWCSVAVTLQNGPIE